MGCLGSLLAGLRSLLGSLGTVLGGVWAVLGGLGWSWAVLGLVLLNLFAAVGHGLALFGAFRFKLLR